MRSGKLNRSGDQRKIVKLARAEERRIWLERRSGGAENLAGAESCLDGVKNWDKVES